jgi:EpsD family peptidyl-prolyl cis-trans isomerase
MSPLLRMERIHLFFALILLAGCSGDDAGRNPGVAAKVNNAEISVEQVQRMVVPENGLDGQEGLETLERLIDQELMVQKARQRHLERDPEVARELEAARREILVRAYLDRVVGPAAPPSEAEINAFFLAHPALFEKRRIYELQEIVVQLEGVQFEALQAVVSRSRSVDEVLQWMSGKSLGFRTTKAVRAAEQLPLESLDSFARMRNGEIALAPTSTGAQMIHLVRARSEPLDLMAARPLIEEYLTNDRMVEAARAELTRLRGSARIQYGARFAREEGRQGAQAGLSMMARESPAAKVSGEPIKAAFERGVAGLR